MVDEVLGSISSITTKTYHHSSTHTTYKLKSVSGTRKREMKIWKLGIFLRIITWLSMPNSAQISAYENLPISDLPFSLFLFSAPDTQQTLIWMKTNMMSAHKKITSSVYCWCFTTTWVANNLSKHCWLHDRGMHKIQSCQLLHRHPTVSGGEKPVSPEASIEGHFSYMK
jgi:hypothetical protein